MKAFKNIKGFFTTLMVASALSMTVTSCDNELSDAVTDDIQNKEEKTMVMHFDGDCPSYDDMQTRATSAEWNNGDIIYLRFFLTDNTTVICGKAVYNATKSAWQLSYYGNISVGSKCKCEAFFFTGANAKDNYNIELSGTSGAYIDEDAFYIVEDGELYVTATLAPKTARMRIKGTPNKEIWVSAVIYNTSFNLTKKEFTSGSDEFRTEFGEDGYTPYMYVSLNEKNEITLRDNYWQYTKTFDAKKFAAGESGYITMPSQEENKGWADVYYYPESAVDLGLSVRWATMNIGATTAYEAGIFCSWGDADGTNTSTYSYYNESVHAIAGNPEYDIVTKEWGERWQIPSQEQWQELMDNCTWTYAYDSEKSMYGYTVTGKNGNQIYLPMYAVYDRIPTGVVFSSSYGYYWTSTEGSQSHEGYCLQLSSSEKKFYSGYYKYKHMCIRPVLVK